VRRRKARRATIDRLPIGALVQMRHSAAYNASGLYQVARAPLEEANRKIAEHEPTMQRWKEAVPRLHDCIEARKAELEEEAKGLTAAAATGTINGNCTGYFSLMGKKERTSWPLQASLQVNRNTEGDVRFALVTKERGQEMTLQGKYGPNFAASGNLGTVRMSVQGTLSEHPDQPELLQGSGTGQTTDSSELQVSCKFSWRTSP